MTASKMTPGRVEDTPRLLYGAIKIAEYLGITERQARHQIEQDRLPHFKIGKTICAYPSKIDAWLEKLSGGEAA